MKLSENSKQLTVVLLASILCLGARTVLSQSTMTPAGAAVPSDNTKSNKLDPSDTAASADRQKNDSSDTQITQRIRKSLMADKSLSTYAHNVKIVTVNGKVTLNGVVRSDEEKNAIETKAVSVAGQGSVVNDIKVSPKT